MKSWGFLEQLSALPPRGSATEGERQAAQWIHDQLSDMGYEVKMQRFASPRHTLYLGPVLVMTMMLTATWLSGHWPALAAILAAACLVPLIGEMLGARINFDLILPKRPSQNVIARLPRANSVPAADDRAANAEVVIVAHYDTQWGSWLFAPFFRAMLRPFFVITYIGLVLALVSVWLRWALPGVDWVSPLMTAGTVLIIVTGAFLVASWLTGRPVSGANDNGSGVAVAMALAARWQEHSPGTFQPVFLFTGCEEVGLRGMHHFLAVSSINKNTRFINLDNVGGGRLRFLLGEGMLGYQHYDPEMIAVARTVAARYGDEIRPLKNLLLPTDGLLPAKAGYPTITFLAANDDESIPQYHWHTDTLDNAERGVVGLTERYVWDVIMALDEGTMAEGP